MKVFPIFHKNLKSVARSWPYFAILFILPVVLIIVAGMVLNSVDFDNVQVGIIGSSSGLDMSGVSSPSSYGSLSDCLFDLVGSRMTICIHSFDEDSGKNLDIYLDNSNKIVSFYARQFIMSNLLDLQTGALRDTSSEISSKIALYSTSIETARKDLIEASNELDEQERLLVDYRSDLTQLRSDFDEAYYPLKAMESDINTIQTDLHSYNTNLEGNISDVRSRIDAVEQKLATLSGFLSTRLGGGDLSYVSDLIADINSDLAEIDAILGSVGGVDPQVVQIIDSLDLIIVQLDEIKQTLDSLDADLEKSITRTRESRNRIDAFVVDLDKVSSELSGVDRQIGSNQVSFSLNEAFDLPKDPVLLAFPLLIALIITFTSLVLSNMFILKEVNQKSYSREVISPAWGINFLFADYLVNLFFVAVQAAVLFLVGSYLFSLPISEISIFSLAIFLAASIFIFIGMGIGYLIKHQSLSMLLTIFLVMILIVLSDILAPSILASDLVKFFIGLNPFMILKKILEDRLVLGRGLRDISEQFFKLVVFFISTFFVAYFANKFSKEAA
jgi:ABC-type multidrug transport system permease subunit